MNLLVLGGNGYLGTKLVKRLVAEGDTVVCTKREKSNLTMLEGVDVTWVDATAGGVAEAYNRVRFDAVINMACNYANDSPTYDSVLAANLEFPLQMMNLSVHRGTKTFITMGTGLPDSFNMYSFSKSIFSQIGEYYAKSNNINFLELKLEMFYGADEPADRFIPSIVRKMLLGEEVNTTIGTQHRDIVSEEDILKAIMGVLHSGAKGYRKIPVGTGIAPSISELIDFIADETKSQSRVNKGAIPMRKNEPSGAADISVISELMEWKPVFWKDGIRQMIEKTKVLMEEEK